MDFTTGVNHMTPEENQEAYWLYFKKNQSDLTEQWKTFWAKIYTRMTEISGCGSAITMPESSYPRME